MKSTSDLSCDASLLEYWVDGGDGDQDIFREIRFLDPAPQLKVFLENPADPEVVFFKIRGGRFDGRSLGVRRRGVKSLYQLLGNGGSANVVFYLARGDSDEYDLTKMKAFGMGGLCSKRKSTD